MKLLTTIFSLLLITATISRVPSLSYAAPSTYLSSEPTPGPMDYDTEGIFKQIVLRTVDGAPVEGIEVQLIPASPELGGPPTDRQAQQATTDKQGAVILRDLGRWVWMATFTGAFQGRNLQPVSEQGRAPWGRTRTGNGFPLMLQRQEEDAAATPITVGGIPQVQIQPSMFVLVPTQDGWAPTLDLSLPGQLPEPLFVIPTAVPLANSISAPGVQVSSSSTAADLSELAQWLYGLPVAVALLAIYTAWQQGKQKRKSGYQQTSTGNNTEASPSDKEGGI